LSNQKINQIVRAIPERRFKPSNSEFDEIYTIIQNKIESKYHNVNNIIYNSLKSGKNPNIFNFPCGSGKSYTILLWVYYLTKFTHYTPIVLIDDYENGLNNIMEINEILVQLGLIDNPINFTVFNGKLNMCMLDEDNPIKQLIKYGFVTNSYCKKNCIYYEDCLWFQSCKDLYEGNCEAILLTNRQIHFLLKPFLSEKFHNQKFILFFDESLLNATKKHYKIGKNIINDNINGLQHILKKNLEINKIIEKIIKFFEILKSNFNVQYVNYENIIIVLEDLALDVIGYDNLFRNISSIIFEEIVNKKLKPYKIKIDLIQYLTDLALESSIFKKYEERVKIVQRIFLYKPKYISILFIDDWTLKNYIDSPIFHSIINTDGTADKELSEFIFNSQNINFISESRKTENIFRLNYNFVKITLLSQQSRKKIIDDMGLFIKYAYNKLGRKINLLLITREIKADDFKQFNDQKADSFGEKSKNINIVQTLIERFQTLLKLPKFINTIKIEQFPLSATNKYKKYDACITFTPFFPKSIIERESLLFGKTEKNYRKFIETDLGMNETIFSNHATLKRYFLNNRKIDNWIKLIEKNFNDWFTVKDCKDVFKINLANTIIRLKKMCESNLLEIDLSGRLYKYKIVKTTKR